jgi:short-subunit dehydrogenase
VDVTDVVQLEKEMIRIDQQCPIDLLVVNAGVSSRTLLDASDQG